MAKVFCMGVLGFNEGKGRRLADWIISWLADGGVDNVGMGRWGNED
ncbi:MAG: hypothetical protein ACXVLT_05455 [Flavisolibacter sp.]